MITTKLCKNSHIYDAARKICPICKAIYDKQRYQNISEEDRKMANERRKVTRSKEYDRLWRIKNKEKTKEYTARYRQKNVEKIKLSQKNYRQRNKSLLCYHSAQRRAALRNATPRWLTEDHKLHIKEHYIVAEALSKEFGQPMEVDHIIPLKGENICGLHVPWNLQIMAATANRSKKNKICVD